MYYYVLLKIQDTGGALPTQNTLRFVKTDAQSALNQLEPAWGNNGEKILRAPNIVLKLKFSFGR